MTRADSSGKSAKPLKPGLASGVALAAILVALGVFGVSSFRAVEARQGETSASPIPVDAFEINYINTAEIEERFPALIQAKRESALGFERGGRVDQILVDVGDEVAHGQVLAILDIRALTAQIAAAEAQAREARAQGQLAQVTLERQRQLVEQGHISAQRLDEASAQADAARARIAGAQASLTALQVELDLANLKAPFAGVITARHMDEGAIASPGAPIVQIVEHQALEASVGLPVEEAAGLVAGERYHFEVDGRQIEGRFRAATGVVDRQSRVVSAVFDIDASQNVAPGAVARLILNHSLAERGFWVPISALSEGRRGLWTVYILTPEGEGSGAGQVVSARTVEVIHTEGERVYIRGAVDDRSLIIHGGTQRVTPGQHVVLRRAEG
ncbi:efflux RND transporter periplasmic adaptor subunit [Woodsholea maritima]|uniref:efflux RND transporter periplasmic adaptor subunit n=1 Tax=Woodsholea maritima TaxID=240237 RepID=UPI00036419D9|nr:efflux RND transporter periplasmic adaptor subunit [Woodsholea maritima]